MDNKRLALALAVAAMAAGYGAALGGAEVLPRIDFAPSLKGRGYPKSRSYVRWGGRNPAGTKIARKAARGQLTKR